MWFFQWIFELSWKFDGNLKPSRQKFIEGDVTWRSSTIDIAWRSLAITSWKNIINKHMFGLIGRPNVMIGIWIVVISRMTTTFIFYLMTLLHLL